jgi:hypothetical protein
MINTRPPDLPPWWVRLFYRYLAAGRYAAEWLPELLVFYDQMVAEDGEDAAFNWAVKELALFIKPSIAARMLWILRFAHRVWKIRGE